MAIRGRNNLTGEIFFFITTTVIQHIQVFTEDEYSEVLIKNIKYYQEKFQFDILAYVIMPSHFHWIVEINPKKGTISDVMRDIKKHSAWDIMDLLKTRNKKDVLKIFEVNAKDSWRDIIDLAIFLRTGYLASNVTRRFHATFPAL